MATYVALLRGINVGGKNVIPMAGLAKTFVGLGLEAVKTYIASGNVLFQTEDADARALEKRVERALTKAHAYDATVVIKSQREMAAIVAGIPKEWKRPNKATRYNVIFLRHEVDSNEVLAGLGPKPDLELVSYRPGVLYWSARFEDLPRTAMIRLGTKPIYKKVTVRGLNTTKKIFELMKQM